MKNILVILVLFTMSFCNQVKKDTIKSENEIEEGLIGVQEWFDAWELIAADILEIQAQEPPLLIFFNDQYVFTNSNEPAKNSIKVNGPTYFGKELHWSKAEHYDSLTLPTGQKVPIGLMSFAGSTSNGSEEAFFIMGVPSFWKDAKVTSNELGDENLYTSVFLHEFAHSQQNRIFGVRLDQFEKSNEFKFELSDDMIQEDFEKDSAYLKDVKDEIATFYRAFHSDNNKETKQLLIKGLNMYKQRQEKYFVKERAIYKTLDDFFLTMEGIGQYVAVAWLTHPEGADLSIEHAVEGMRRGGKWWSQDESLALFLIYNKITKPDLGSEMFGTKLYTINQLLEEQVE